MIHTRVRDFYDRHASEHDMDDAGLLDVSSVEEAIYRDRQEKATLRRLLPRRPFPFVLEIGCGNGRWLEFFSPMSGRVVGMDISFPILQHARRRLERKPISNADLVVGDACRLPFRSECGLLYLSSLLIYLSDEEVARVLADARECLSPDGLLLIRDSLSTTDRYERKDEYFAIYRSRSEFDRFLAGAGFRLLRSAPSYQHLRQPFWMGKLLPCWAHRHMPLFSLRLADTAIDILHRLTHPSLGRPPAANIHLFMVCEKR